LYLQEKCAPFGGRVLPQLITPKWGWLKLGVGLQELLAPKRVFLALNQALPYYTPAKIIAFSHGAAPLFFPTLYPDSHQKLKQQTQIILNQSRFVIVGSKKIQQEMVSQFGLTARTARKLIVLPYGIGQLFLDAKPQYKRKNLLLFVGSNHPIKNLAFLLSCFKELIKDSHYSNYKLALLGISSRELKREDQSNSQIIPLGHLPYTQLIKYYQEASCLLSASHYESFNLPILEALSQNTPVVATKSAVIPELEEYVNTCPSEAAAFLKLLKKTLATHKPVNLSKLKAKFNWESYVKKLIALYAQ
jgi:glycosyltransferase involved in cell wall biosynthesis